jgi:N-glycosylase/DNA lyase
VHLADTNKWYEELVYCLLTAYASARMGQKCVDALCYDKILIDGSLKDITDCLITEGHRFAKTRADYIYNTRQLAPTIKQKIQSFKETKQTRDWLTKNIKGIGLKEASHYLRNVGYFDLAILDRHIIANMNEHEIIDHPKNKSLTRKRYLEYEEKLQLVADKLNLLPGELDLYMWYRKTGKVMK